MPRGSTSITTSDPWSSAIPNVERHSAAEIGATSDQQPDRQVSDTAHDELGAHRSRRLVRPRHGSTPWRGTSSVRWRAPAARDRFVRDGRYVPPFGQIGLVIDAALLHVVARRTVQAFFSHESPRGWRSSCGRRPAPRLSGRCIAARFRMRSVAAWRAASRTRPSTAGGTRARRCGRHR